MGPRVGLDAVTKGKVSPCRLYIFSGHYSLRHLEISKRCWLGMSDLNTLLHRVSWKADLSISFENTKLFYIHTLNSDLGD
jgi:hypothetical protein